MKRQSSGRISLAVAALALAAAVALGAGEPAKAPAEVSAPAEAKAPGDSGLRVYLDPETGELKSRPADPADGSEHEDGRLSPRERLNTYGGDLLQERLDRGGFKVDLRGRFQSSVVATIDPVTNEVSIDCVAVPVARASEPPDESRRTGEGEGRDDD